ANRGGVGDVIHLGAVRDQAAAVLDLLFAEAFREGVVALRGRLEPLWLPALLSRGASLVHTGAWTLLHTRRPEIAAAVLAGDAMLTRLERETWLNF
ncbi:MAG TPA: hypothetical protein VNH46_10055, partial [Gemmatimonadales bacterium]|nr:hypothetical protein [Gemmatimonadales bacterium]